MAGCEHAVGIRPLRQVARFGLVGVINTLVDYVLFITFTIVFRIPLSRVWVAKYPSSVVAMIVSYILNRRFVFRSQQRDVAARGAAVLLDDPGGSLRDPEPPDAVYLAGH